MAASAVGLGYGARVAARQVNQLAKETAKAAPEAAQKAASAAGKEGAKAGAEASGSGSSSMGGLFDFSRKFYEGGFQPELTKREAALILGVRERAPKEKILERYRVLMRKNHPDRGGSPLLSMKINEAKDLMSKTARSERGRRSFHSSAHHHNRRQFSTLSPSNTQYQFQAYNSAYRTPSSVNTFARSAMRK